MNYISHTEKSIENSNNAISKLTPEILAIHDGDSCMSSHLVRHLLNNICSFEGCNFLEIGSWRGSTFQSAIFNNNLKATSIDFWPDNLPFRESRSIFYRNLYHVLEKETNDMYKEIRIVNQDCFLFNKEGLKDINVYLYDGDHSEESQRKGLVYYNDILADEAVIIVDDWNASEVKNGTRKAIKELNWEILKEWELPGQLGNWGANSGLYWNGLFVAVIQK